MALRVFACARGRTRSFQAVCVEKGMRGAGRARLGVCECVVFGARRARTNLAPRIAARFTRVEERWRCFCNAHARLEHRTLHAVFPTQYGAPTFPYSYTEQKIVLGGTTWLWSAGSGSTFGDTLGMSHVHVVHVHVASLCLETRLVPSWSVAPPSLEIK